MKKKLGLLAAFVLTLTFTAVKADTEAGGSGPCKAPWQNVCLMYYYLDKHIPVMGTYTYVQL